MRPLLVLPMVGLLFVLGCAEKVLIRSTPPGASVYVDNQPVGTTPVVFESRNPRPVPYRVEKAGYPKAEGVLETQVSRGRIVGAIFTAGILRIFRPFRYFVANPLDVNLGPVAPPAGIVRLYNVKSATVLEGECVQQNGSCRIVLPSGERCSGDYVRENQGTTTVSSTTKTVTGGGVGLVGGDLATVGIEGRKSVVAGGKEVSNMNKAVAIFRCHEAIIDCTLMVDSFAMQGHGECQDTRGATYRLTMVPKRDEE